jgi:hypothetical protein
MLCRTHPEPVRVLEHEGGVAQHRTRLLDTCHSCRRHLDVRVAILGQSGLVNSLRLRRELARVGQQARHIAGGDPRFHAAEQPMILQLSRSGAVRQRQGQRAIRFTGPRPGPKSPAYPAGSGSG